VLVTTISGKPDTGRSWPAATGRKPVTRTPIGSNIRHPESARLDARPTPWIRDRILKLEAAARAGPQVGVSGQGTSGSDALKPAPR